MSEIESRFIRQLKITLISVIGPFMLLTIGSMINDHFKIKNNQEHIEMVEKTMVSREIMLLYVDELRETNKILKTDLTKSCDDTNAKLLKVNDEMDDLMRDVFRMKQRSAKQDNEDNGNYSEAIK